MSDYLPKEVMMDILARLPVKTILQIRCVCKSWCSLISSDNFVTFCLNRTTHLNNINNTHLLLIRHYTDPQKQKDFSMFLDNEALFQVSLGRHPQEYFSLYHDNEAFTEYHLNLESRPIADTNYFGVLGCCNGLVCLTENIVSCRDHLYLWNPTIRKFVVLPEPRITFESHGPYDRALGYGFDSISNDYKVVRIVYICEEDIYSLKKCDWRRSICGSGPIPYIDCEVDIYSLKEGGWRRSITASAALPYIDGTLSHGFVNGAIHWVSGGGGFAFIVSFNVGTEVFSEMELPTSLRLVQERRLSLAVFQDSLWVFQNVSCKASIWVMKEYGVVESWTNLFNLDFSSGGSVNVIGLRRNGEVLLTQKEEMISADIKANKFKYLEIRGEDAAFCVNTYTESLVLVDKVNGGSGEQSWPFRTKKSSK